MLMDIVKTIVVSQDDFDLAGEIIGRDGVIQAAKDAQADVIVLRALVATEIKGYHDLLYDRPRMKIISIAIDGRDAIVHELQPHLIALGEVAPDSLVAAIRATPDADSRASESGSPIEPAQ
jgi:DNA-binding NarL/FixJ family response regulator